MAFIKPTTIYHKGRTHVYINQCHAKGLKTKVYAIRKDDTTGLAYLLGTIKWSGGWRQYVFQPEANTIWSNSCLLNIRAFLGVANDEHRKQMRK